MDPKIIIQVIANIEQAKKGLKSLTTMAEKLGKKFKAISQEAAKATEKETKARISNAKALEAEAKAGKAVANQKSAELLLSKRKEDQEKRTQKATEDRAKSEKKAQDNFAKAFDKSRREHDKTQKQIRDNLDKSYKKRFAAEDKLIKAQEKRVRETIKGINQEIAAADKRIRQKEKLIEKDRQMARQAKETRDAIGFSMIGFAASGLRSAGMAGENLIRSTVTGAADIERTTDSLKALLGTAAQAQQGLQVIREISLLPATTEQQARKAIQQLIAYNFQLHESALITREFSNSVALANGGALALTEVLKQVGQATRRDKFEQQELNALIEYAPTLYKSWERYLGQSIVSGEQFTEATIAMSGSVKQFVLEATKFAANDAPRASTETLANEFSNLQNQVNFAYQELGKQFIPEIRALTKLISGAINAFRELDPAVQKIIGLTVVAGTIFAKIGVPIAELIGQIAILKWVFGSATTVIIGHLKSIAISVGALAAKFALMATPIAGIVAGLGLMAGAIREANKRAKEGTVAWKNYYDQMTDVKNISDYKKAVDDLIGSLTSRRANLLERLGFDSVQDLLSAAPNQFRGTAAGIRNEILTLTKDIDSFNKVLGTLAEGGSRQERVTLLGISKDQLKEYRSELEDINRTIKDLDITRGPGTDTKPLDDAIARRDILNKKITETQKRIMLLSQAINSGDDAKAIIDLELEFEVLDGYIIQAEASYNRFKKALSESPSVSASQVQEDLQRQLQLIDNIERVKKEQAKNDFERTEKTAADKQFYENRLTQITIDAENERDAARKTANKRDADRIQRSQELFERSEKNKTQALYREIKSRKLLRQAQSDHDLWLATREKDFAKDKLDAILQDEKSTDSQKLAAKKLYEEAYQAFDTASTKHAARSGMSRHEAQKAWIIRSQEFEKQNQKFQENINEESYKSHKKHLDQITAASKAADRISAESQIAALRVRQKRIDDFNNSVFSGLMKVGEAVNQIGEGRGPSLKGLGGLFDLFKKGTDEAGKMEEKYLQLSETVGRALFSELGNALIGAPQQKADALESLANRVEDRLEDIRGNELMSEERKQQMITAIYRDAAQQRDQIDRQYEDASLGRALANAGKVLQQQLLNLAIEDAVSQAYEKAKELRAAGDAFGSQLFGGLGAGASALFGNPLGLLSLLIGGGIALHSWQSSKSRSQEAEQRLRGANNFIAQQRVYDSPARDRKLERTVVEALAGPEYGRSYHMAVQKSADDQTDAIGKAVINAYNQMNEDGKMVQPIVNVYVGGEQLTDMIIDKGIQQSNVGLSLQPAR